MYIPVEEQNSFIKWILSKFGNVIDPIENDIVDEIIRSMREEPQEWHFSACTAEKHLFSLWIANAPYADMEVNGKRLPRRNELRKAVALCSMGKYLDLIKSEL